MFLRRSTRKPAAVSFPRRAAALALPVAMVLGLALGAGSASAQEGRVYALVSLLGDKMTVVSQQERTGSHINQNTVDVMDLQAGLMDTTALAALAKAAQQFDPGSKVVPLKLPSATLFGEPDKLFKDTQFLVPAQLDASFKQVNATHALIVTPYRAPANIRGWRVGVGSGSLEGVGFYIDRDLKTSRAETNDRFIGYLAPFSYFKIRLVNLATGTVERQQGIVQAEMRTSNKPEAANDVWQVLNAREKMIALTDMVTSNIVDTMPALLQNK